MSVRASSVAERNCMTVSACQQTCSPTEWLQLKTDCAALCVAGLLDSDEVLCQTPLQLLFVPTAECGWGLHHKTPGTPMLQQRDQPF